MRTHATVSVLVWTALSLIPVEANAQNSPIDRGSWIVSGSASFDRQQVDGRDSWSIYVSPSVARFVARGLAIGGVGGVGYSHIDGLGSSTTLLAGPTISYYAGTPGGRLYPHAGAAYSYRWQKYRQPQPAGPDRTQRDHASVIEAFAGTLYMVARNVGLHGQVYYEYRWYESTIPGFSSSSEASRFGVRSGLSVFIY